MRPSGHQQPKRPGVWLIPHKPDTWPVVNTHLVHWYICLVLITPSSSTKHTYSPVWEGKMICGLKTWEKSPCPQPALPQYGKEDCGCYTICVPQGVRFSLFLYILAISARPTHNQPLSHQDKFGWHFYLYFSTGSTISKAFLYMFYFYPICRYWKKKKPQRT